MERFKTIVFDVLFTASCLFWIIISSNGDFYKLLGMIVFFTMAIFWLRNSNTAKKGLEFVGEMFEEGAKEMYGE